MNDHNPFYRPRIVFNEHEIVRLINDITTSSGIIPEGVEGTVLQVFADGHAYQIEFEGPYDTPETVVYDNLERVSI